MSKQTNSEHSANWRIRTACPADLSMICELEQICFADPWQPASLARDLQGQTPAQYLVVELNTQIIACAGWWNMIDAAEIIHIAVLPDYRRRGIAAALLRQMISDATNEGLPEMRLEMRRGNHAAQASYRAAGFEAIAVRTNYYEKPSDDAIIMLKKLTE